MRRLDHTLVSTLMLGGILNLAVVGSFAAHPDWQLEVVDDVGDVGSYNSAAIDGATPVVAYFDATDGEVWYASFNGTTWDREVVATGVGLSNVHTSVAILATGQPGISYYNNVADSLWFAERDVGGTWTLTEVDTAPFVGQYCSLIAMNQEVDEPAISYWDQQNGTLKYAWRNGGTWNTTTIDSDSVQGFSSMQWVPGYGPGIAYIGADYALHFAWWDGAWNLKVVDEIRAFLHASLAINPTGDVAIGYFDQGFSALRFAWHLDAGFDFQTGWTKYGITSGGAGEFNSLNFLSTGIPIVSYFDPADGLGFAWSYAPDAMVPTWYTQIVDEPATRGRYTSLVRVDGRPAVFYYDSANGNLLFAQLAADADCNENGLPDSGDIEAGFSADCNSNNVPDECDLANGDSQDCNTNSIPDECDIAGGTSEDCNTNDVPDECDIASGNSLDCNTNGIPDECDIAGGASQDCNSNNVPDECDIADMTSEDCNSNGIPDECDLASGDSQDCNSNGVPDECDIADMTSLDCNSNGIPDECDLADGTSEDCNSNGVPDECDIADGISADCNSNGIPDECEPGGTEDCNSNGVPDLCDIFEGTSADCNANSVPDECDIAGGTSGDCNSNDIPDECELGGAEDCNGNGTPDLCDIYEGTSEDCNANGIPDECDIAGGTSGDCNINGVPDECDIAGGTSGDCNSNDIPDECEVGGLEDCNGNGTPDLCDIYEGTSEDCNANAIPDVCDIAGGTSGDCNINGVPDECDIAGGASEDCNSNLIPDECEPDTDSDGVIDDCEVGACCLGAGDCLDLMAWECVDAGGVFLEDIGCDTDPCAELGACCAPDDSCTISIAALCQGDFMGIGTDCDPNPCGIEWCLGDLNCSGGAPDFADILYFASAVGDQTGWEQYYQSQHSGANPPCPWLLGDFSGSAGVDFSDIAPFANSVGQACIPYPLP